VNLFAGHFCFIKLLLPESMSFDLQMPGWRFMGLVTFQSTPSKKTQEVIIVIFFGQGTHLFGYQTLARIA
tara:strand:+ start:365 stop:574 length:210 start_codon:yes stop_codon:yes gene_type:complete